ncbi:hypothetical protein FF100_05030 [Methylobacterium terricola]|uniref:Uncharacterized protein n=1 Tax=Methylobacterium terricola TaxID=2583531 RepID=A0A5C4LMY1_9HYPH|nr:hypothetical protein [Methylobacterium terricola]TNC14940.1 hypothetical protein FF100_05030 [Methylobacterium terricola]
MSALTSTALVARFPRKPIFEREKATRSGNSAPSCRWVDQNNFMPEGVTRQRLFVNDCETPFFIDVAERASHRTEGQKCGLFGSGMSAKGFAKTLASGPRVGPLKHRAEQMAMEQV